MSRGSTMTATHDSAGTLWPLDHSIRINPNTGEIQED